MGWFQDWHAAYAACPVAIPGTQEVTIPLENLAKRRDDSTARRPEPIPIETGVSGVPVCAFRHGHDPLTESP
jgi:hypothetical protein